VIAELDLNVPCAEQGSPSFIMAKSEAQFFGMGKILIGLFFLESHHPGKEFNSENLF